MPPAFGPTAPPSEINIGVTLALGWRRRQSAGIRTTAASSSACAASDTTTMRESPSL